MNFFYNSKKDKSSQPKTSPLIVKPKSPSKKPIVNSARPTAELSKNKNPNDTPVLLQTHNNSLSSSSSLGPVNQQQSKPPQDNEEGGDEVGELQSLLHHRAGMI